jgi:hypothetical protein
MQMARLWTTLMVLVVACLVTVNMASAQGRQGKKGQKGGKTPDAGKMFDDAEKAAKHDPLTGVLTKDEFVKGLKESGSRMASHAEQMFDRIKKADNSKVTKEEFTTFLKDFMGNRGKKKK